MARKNRTPKTDAALEAEIAVNETAAPAIIDHHSQLDSWSMIETSVEDADELSPADEAALMIAELAEDVVEPTTTVAEPEINAPTNFEAALASFPDDVVTEMAFKIAAAVDERVEFEEFKNPENVSIQRTLKKVRQELVTKRAARVLLATNVEPTFINRTLHDGSRYNVYALGKLADLVRSIVDGHGLNNAINNAVTKSLFRCKNAGISFTGDVARAAASDKLRIDSSIASRLVRHTVSASTAPTQASSTMSALATLGVVKAEGSQRNPTYVVTENPISRFLEAKLLAA